MSLELTQPTGAGSSGSPAPGRAQERTARQGRLAWWLAQARAQPMAAVGAAIVLGWVLVAIFAPVIAPYSYKHGDYLMAAPSLQHPFGKDNLGRDVLSRVMYGSQTVLLLAVLSTLASLVCGSIVALCAGYYGGLVDEVLMRFADAAMALPAILLGLLIVAMAGPSNVGLFVATVIVFTPLVARVVRSAVLPLVGREFVAAARLRGERGPSIMLRELVPNLLGVLAGAECTMSGETVLEVRHLHVTYRQGHTELPALRDISLTLSRGEAYGIIGESGSGKSTLAFAIMRHLGNNGRISRGTVLFRGRDVLQMSEPELRALRGERIAMVYQQPQAALNPSIPLGEQVAEVFTAHARVSRQEAHRRALQMLAQVRLRDPEATARLYPHQASGGMQQRVVIAMALAMKPDLIILDEPTTALDVTTQAAVLELLEELRREFGTALIFIAHDLAVITRICERIAVFYAGEMVEEAGLRDLFRRPHHPYTAGLLECLPARGVAHARQPLTPIPGRLPRLSRLPPGCIFQPRCRYAHADCARTHPDLYETAPGHQARCFYWQEVRVGTGDAAVAAAPQAEPTPAVPLLDVEGVVKEFARPLGAGRLGGGAGQNARVLNAVSLSLSDGDTIGLVGESGSGKTTLARCILGLTTADDGHIRFGARDLPLRIEERDASTLRELQMVFQNPDMSLNPRQTIRTILVRPIRLLSRLGRREAEAAARDLLRAVNLDESYMERYPGQLSGGEKQRVAIARAFATRTKLVICDEPVSGLDVSVQATVLNLLQELQTRWGTAYLFISHDLQVVQYLADRIVVLYRGNIVETGSTDQVFSGPNHPYTELLLSSIPLPDPDAPRVRLALQSEIRAETGADTAGCPFKGRCHRKLGAICETEFPPLRTVDPGHVALCHIPVADLPTAVTRAGEAASPSSLEV